MTVFQSKLNYGVKTKATTPIDFRKCINIETSPYDLSFLYSFFLSRCSQDFQKYFFLKNFLLFFIFYFDPVPSEFSKPKLNIRGVLFYQTVKSRFKLSAIRPPFRKTVDRYPLLRRELKYFQTSGDSYMVFKVWT